jgi:hypothetical protein
MAFNAIIVGLEGVNAETTTDPNDCALYVDDTTDHILIKEKARGTVNVSNGGTVNIAHGLAYIPFCLAFVEISSGVWRKLFSSPIDGVGVWFEINGTNLVLRNTSGSAKTFSYYLFYVNIT